MQTRQRYNFLRLTTIIGGVVVPALVSLNINSNEVRAVFSWLTFGLSQVVAISAAIEEFFHYGEHYILFRNTAERMKVEGWSFLQLSGVYKKEGDHKVAYTKFATRIERIIQEGVKGYMKEELEELQDQTTAEETLENEGRG